MISSSNLILIIIVLIVIFFLLFNNSTSTQVENFYIKALHNPNKRSCNIKKYIEEKTKNYLPDLELISFDGLDSYSNYSSKISQNKCLKSNFVDIQFHNDYRDVISALNNIVPEKGQKFNIANIPLKYSEPDTDEVKKLVKDFINLLNQNIKHLIPLNRNKNTGWDEPICDLTVKSGWDKVQEGLGLQSSLWDPPASKSTIKFIALNNLQKYETDDEIKFLVDVIIQKLNVEDQMIIKISLIQDKREITDENNFFCKKNLEMKVIIEEISIVGYLSEEGPESSLIAGEDNDKFYDFNNMEKNNLVNPKHLETILKDKNDKRNEEINYFNSQVDPETKCFQ